MSTAPVPPEALALFVDFVRLNRHVPADDPALVGVLMAYADALGGRRRPNTRRAITPELLAEVAELHERGGVPLIMATMGVTERNARRWLAALRRDDVAP